LVPLIGERGVLLSEKLSERSNYFVVVVDAKKIKKRFNAHLVRINTRVTRLGEFSPNWRLYTLDSFFSKITETDTFLSYFSLSYG
jgi:hypothetical protein